MLCMSPVPITPPADLRRLLVSFAGAWHARDLDSVLACFHPNAIYFSSVGPLPGEKAHGQTEIRDLIERMFAQDTVISQSVGKPLFFDDSGVQTWAYRGADGRETLGCDLFRFEDGLIVLKDAYRKTFALP